MMKPGDIWGACPYRKPAYDVLEGDMKGFYYKCEKMKCPCNPRYCLGPDEYRETVNEAKGETHE